MVFKFTSEPAEMPVSMEAGRTAARANGTDFDTEIRDQVAALTAKAEHLIGQVIINRTGRLTLASFPDLVAIPETPVFAVVEIQYFDVDGAERTLPSDSYFLNDGGLIERAPGVEWPVTQARSNAVKITVICGYGATEASAPAAFKGYILGKVREFFAPAGTPESPYLDRMLDSLKTYK